MRAAHDAQRSTANKPFLQVVGEEQGYYGGAQDEQHENEEEPEDNCFYGNNEQFHEEQEYDEGVEEVAMATIFPGRAAVKGDLLHDDAGFDVVGHQFGIPEEENSFLLGKGLDCHLQESDLNPSSVDEALGLNQHDLLDPGEKYPMTFYAYVRQGFS